MPLATLTFEGKSLRREAARVLFPDPDSPRIPRISPAAKLKLTPASASETAPSRERYATRRSRTSKRDDMHKASLGPPPLLRMVRQDAAADKPHLHGCEPMVIPSESDKK